MIINMNPNNDFDVNTQGVEVMANNGDLPSVSFDQDGIQVTNTELPFGDDDAKAEEEYNSPKRRRDQLATIASFFGISSCTRNKKFLIGGIGSAALLALAWSVPSMKESHVNKNSAAVRKPALAKSSKVPFAKVTKAKAAKAKASDSPSLGPSFAPSKSNGPTFEPSLTPSASGGPTLGPSLAPSASGSPTLGPSFAPSASGGPTLGPSLTPSESGGPTLGPSFTPSASGGPTLGPSLAPSASGGPTLGPSLTPSASGGPTLGPSLTPSDGPTLGPSLSPKPSSSPDPLSLYDFVGNGFCANSATPAVRDILPAWNYSDGSVATSPSACASKCTDCVNGAVSGGSFRGFTLDSDRGECLCHMDDGSTYNPGAGCADGFYRSDSSGTGEILGIYYVPDAFCYKYKLPDLE